MDGRGEDCKTEGSGVSSILYPTYPLVHTSSGRSTEMSVNSVINFTLYPLIFDVPSRAGFRYL